MSRKIPNQPHPTPDPEKPHGLPRSDRPGHPPPGPGSTSEDSPADSLGTGDDMPVYDSVLDDLNRVLSESMESPEPDPNLEPSGDQPTGAPDPEMGVPTHRPVKVPRTSEIFRSVVGQPVEAGTSTLPTAPVQTDTDRVEFGLRPESAPLGIQPTTSDSADDERPGDTPIPWGQIALLSYASALTFALIWLIGTGRILRPNPPSPRPIAARSPAPEPLHPPSDPVDSTPSPPIPPENLTQLGRSLRIGEIEVTPLEIEAGPVALIHAIHPGTSRREDDCLILRLRLANRSADRTFSPLDRNFVRDRDLRMFDPYIAAAGGQSIRLFPLAIESEWRIRGQIFPELKPGETAETLVVAEPGSAEQMAGEMTWRIRVRTGVYRSDMIGVEFNQDQVQRRKTLPMIDEE